MNTPIPETLNNLSHQRGHWPVIIGIFACAIFLVPLAATLSVMFTGDRWYLMDEGTILYTAFRSATGHVPHLDGPYFYTGGLELLMGILFHVFGATFSVARFSLAVAMGLTASLVYALLTHLGSERWMAVIVALLGTVAAFGMNYHCYPAWYATPVILAAILFFWQGIRTATPGRRYVFFAGILLGLATSLKQTTGAFVFVGFILACFISLAPATIERENNEKRPSLHMRSLLLCASTLPLLILGGLILLLGARLSFLNSVMFLTVPGMYVAFAIHRMSGPWKSELRARAFITGVVHPLRNLTAGAIVGFLPLALFYVTQGGIDRLIGDAFLNVRGVVEVRYSEFKFVEEAATSNPFVFVRWFALFVLPLAISVGAFLLARRHSGNRDRQVLLATISTSLALLYFTLFPIAIRMYVLFLIPLTLIPIGYFADVILKRLFARGWQRVAAMVAVCGLVAGTYIGARYLAGDIERIAFRGSHAFDTRAGDVGFPEASVVYLQPVVHYLDSRPVTESVVVLDVFSKLTGFLTRRPILFDHIHRHASLTITQDDLLAMQEFLRRTNTDIIVIGREYLEDVSLEAKVSALLRPRYALALETQNHLVFQKAER